MNHPFHDANKRTALLVTLSLLHRKKRVITLQQKRLDGFRCCDCHLQMDCKTSSARRRATRRNSKCCHRPMIRTPQCDW